MSIAEPVEAHDLLAYIDASPTPYHAVQETARRLEAAGYERWAESDTWRHDPGTRAFVVRSEGSLIAFEIGSAPLAEAGIRVVGAHTDSPNLRLKPNPDRQDTGARQLSVCTYGGVLVHTWFDRDCSIAGRLVLRGPDGPRALVVDAQHAVARVTNLAIHLQREVVTEGFKPNKELHLDPLIGIEGAPGFDELVARMLETAGDDGSPDDVLAFDLMLYDAQAAALGGMEDDLVFAPRLDNLGSCHAGLLALLAGTGDAPALFTRVLALWDHEEVGSQSAQGARGFFLRDVLRRLVSSGDDLRRAVAAGTLVSADMAHAVHPNYRDRHEPRHLPRLGGGPVIKWNQDQRYATDAVSAGRFVAACERAGVPHQSFVVRNDMACGSTIGPMSAANLGIRTVDVGNPMLSMHSAREMCATADVPLMIGALKAFYETD